MAVFQAAQRGLKNFSMLVSHVLVPPAIEAMLAAPDCRVQGFLAAGHVCTVMGYEEYLPLAAQIPGADCGDRFRAARHPAGHSDVRASNWRPGGRRWKTSIAGRCGRKAIAPRRN